MPLKLNVGFSRKVGERDFGSRGASTNLELELESGLVETPGRLRERIRQLFSLARQSVDDELHGHQGEANGHQPNPSQESGAVNDNGHSSNGDRGQSANGHANGYGNAAPNGNSDRKRSDRRATQSQVRALYAITNRQKLDMTRLLQNRFRIHRPDELSLGDASRLIDELNSSSSREESRT